MTAPLDDAERRDLGRRLPDWTLDGETITRTFRFADFAEAMGFVTSVALAAEAADHHPDITISWNVVTLILTTHSAGALTGADRDLALRIDALA